MNTKMKKIISFILSLCMVLTFLPSNIVFAAENKTHVSADGRFEYEYINSNTYNGVRITKYLGTDNFVSIPSIVDGHGNDIFNKKYKVKEISDDFDANNIIKTLALDAKTLVLHENNFSKMKNLTKIEMNNGTLSDYAFANCDKLKEININDYNDSYDNGNYLLANCPNLKYAYVPYINKSSMFENCTALERVTCDNLFTIGTRVFYNCTSLKYLETTSKETYENVEVGTSAFENCTSLANLDFLENRCSGICITVYANAFKNSGIDSINILNSYDEINLYSGCFGNCNNLTDIYLSNTNTIMQTNVFSNCNNLKNIILNLDNCQEFNGQNITSEYIPIFLGCNAENIVYITAGNTHKSQNNNYNTNETKVEISYDISDYQYYNSSAETIVIKDGVTSIGDYAFANCKNLKNIVIPNTVTSIGSYAFYGCDNLSELVIPDSVTEAGKSVFDNCKNLKKVTLPITCRWISADGYTNNVEEFVFTKGTGETGYNYNWTQSDAYKNLTKNGIPILGLLTLIAASVQGYIDDTIKYCDVTDYREWDASTCNNVKVVINDDVKSIGAFSLFDCPNITNITYSCRLAKQTTGEELEIGSYSTLTGKLNGSIYMKVREEMYLPNLQTIKITAGDKNDENYGIGLAPSNYNKLSGSYESIQTYAFNESWFTGSGISNNQVTLILDKNIKSTATYEFSGIKFKNIKLGIDQCNDVNDNELSRIKTFCTDNITLTEGNTGIGADLTSARFLTKNVTVDGGVTHIGANQFACTGTYTTTEKQTTTDPDTGEETTKDVEVTHDCIHNIYIPKSVKTIDASAFNDAQPNTTIYGYTGSTAETYAKEKNINFVALDANKKLVNGQIIDCNHSNVDETITTAATCEQDGVKHIKCLDCGYEGNVTIPATGHTTETVIAKQKTCTETGTKQVICKICNKVVSEIEIPASHNYALMDEPTSLDCEQEQKYEYECLDCGNTYTETNPITEHELMLYKRVYASDNDCKVTAEDYICKKCGKTYEMEVNYYNHQFFKDSVEPTCLEDGYEEYHCTYCDEYYETDYTKALGHSITKYETTKFPTCTEDGEETGICERCGNSVTQTIPATGHDIYKYTTIKEATCIEPGERKGECSKCKKTITIEIPALGHKVIESSIVTNPTCTENGEETGKCSVCGETVTSVIPATGHKAAAEKTNVKAATCTEKGYTGDTVCSVCGEILTKGYETVATGHKAGSDATITKEATCMNTGLKTYTCTKCGGQIVNEIIPALGHDYPYSYTTTTEATCTAEGEKERACTRCGNKEIVKIEKKAHTVGDDVAINKEATCTEDGSRTYTCSVCNQVITNEVIPALGHNYTSEVTKPATCTEEGEGIKTCSRCNDKVIYTINKTSHKYDYTKVYNGNSYTTVYKYTVTKQPTCTETGIEAIMCTECGYIKNEKTVPALGHITKNYVITKQPTCIEDGEKRGECLRCNKEFTEAIAKTGHIPGEDCIISKEATCSETGLRSYTCAICGEKIVDEEIPTIEHTVDNFEITTQPTCINTGLKTGKCTVCGREVSKIIPVTNHTPGEYTYSTEPSCTTYGLRTTTCSVCGLEYDEIVNPTGHKYGDWTPNGDRTHTKRCTVCAYEITDDCTYKSEVISPTCTKDGYTKYTCSECRDSYTTDIVKAVGHQWRMIEKYDTGYLWECSEKTGLPTCGKQVFIEGADFNPPDLFLEDSHTYGEPKTIAPTCTEQGYDIATCTDEGCDSSYKYNYTNALGHSYVYTSNGDHATHTVTCSRVNAGTPCDYQEQANCNFDETGHCTYCNQTGLYDITAKVVVMEDQDNSHSHNYGVANVKIKINNETVATTNDSGSFTVTDLEPGTYELTLNYEYGYDRTVTVTVAGSDINYEGNIPLITCNFKKDNLMNLNDTIKFYEAMNNNNSIADINNDSEINIYDLKIMNKVKGIVELNFNVYIPIVIV